MNIEYQYDGAHDARPTEHTLHGLDGLNLSGLDWMRLSHVCRLMAARDRKPKRAFVRVSGWTADGSNSRKERNRIMADPKYMRKIQGMCRCQDCGLMADNADIDVELDCDEIVFEWSDADDSQTCNLPPCYGGHRLQTDMTAYDLLLELGVIDDPYARNKERD